MSKNYIRKKFINKIIDELEEENTIVKNGIRYFVGDFNAIKWKVENLFFNKTITDAERLYILGALIIHMDYLSTK